jgi:hypothetical protein
MKLSELCWTKCKERARLLCPADCNAGLPELIAQIRIGLLDGDGGLSGISSGREFMTNTQISSHLHYISHNKTPIGRIDGPTEYLLQTLAAIRSMRSRARASFHRLAAPQCPNSGKAFFSI